MVGSGGGPVPTGDQQGTGMAATATIPDSPFSFPPPATPNPPHASPNWAWLR